MKAAIEKYTLYKPVEAEAAAAELRKYDPEWTYTVVHCPAGTGLSYIDVYDNVNNYLGKF